MRIRTNLIVCLLALAAMLGCGTPGAPQPPSLELPSPVTDLVAVRKGNYVVLSWTPSQRTTDKQNIRHSGVTRVCRAIDQHSINQCTTILREIPYAEIPQPTARQLNPKMVFEDTIPSSALSSQGFATYAIEMLNNRGRSAGLSNQVRIPLAPAALPPQGLSALVTAEGVVITFSKIFAPPAKADLRSHYRLLRRPAGQGQFTLVEDVPINLLTNAIPDKSFEWEQTYEYKITPVTDVLQEGQPVAEVEGEDSAIIRTEVHDTFPPAQTTGLQAVFSGAGQQAFIDLTWAPNTESDLAGYEVFRRVDGAKPVKISSELVKTPSFRDETVKPDTKYYYSVRAVDLRGNAGPMSEEASEVAPATTP